MMRSTFCGQWWDGHDIKDVEFGGDLHDFTNDFSGLPLSISSEGVRVRPEEGRTDEASKVYGRADYRCVEGMRPGA